MATHARTPGPRRASDGRGILARVAVVVLSTFLVRCILLVSPPTGGDHCRFAGTGSLCGSCVDKQCQATVDACCGDTGCTAALSDLESCTTKHGSGCAALQAGRENGKAGSALAACIAARCRGECEPFSGQSQTHCSEPPFGQATVCTCGLSSQPNDFVCSPSDYVGTLCCAPDGWPSTGIQCACKPLGCSPTSDGCFCSLVDYDPTLMGATDHCKTNHCCVQNNTCTCRSSPCYAFEMPVTECSVAAVGCAVGQKPVSSCSIYGPGK